MTRLRDLGLVAAALATALSVSWPQPAQAQRDAVTERLFRELRPNGGRGIGGDPYANRPAQPESLAARRDPQAEDPATPPAAMPARARQGAASPERSNLAARQPVPERTTTAPAGVPASSLMVLFETGSATLASTAQAELNGLGVVLRDPEMAGYRFRIEGHTDRVGSEATNLALSERRAEAVRDFLVQNFGIAATRLTVAGLGESQTLVPTPDETPNPRNRRVQVLNVGPAQD